MERVVTDDGRGVVGRKEGAVVLEDADVVAEQLAVGGPGIDDIGAAGAERFVGEAVFHAADVGDMEAVRGGESRPAVLAVQELVADAGGEPVLDGHQVGDGADAEHFGTLPVHGQRVAVGEAERLEPGQAPSALELVLHVEVRAERLVDAVGAAELDAPAGAGVLG